MLLIILNRIPRRSSKNLHGRENAEQFRWTNSLYYSTDFSEQSITYFLCIMHNCQFNQVLDLENLKIHSDENKMV